MTAFPKPTPRPKKQPKGLRRTWMKRGARGTAHSRRKRDLGFMAFCRSLGCDVRMAYFDEFGSFAIPADFPACAGPAQFMHLPHAAAMGAKGPDSMGACGCERHHRGIDGKEGGKDRYYVELGYDGQQALRARLRARATARWEALTQAERYRWG